MPQPIMALACQKSMEILLLPIPVLLTWWVLTWWNERRERYLKKQLEKVARNAREPGEAGIAAAEVDAMIAQAREDAEKIRRGRWHHWF